MANLVTVQDLVERSKTIAATHPPKTPLFSELESAGMAPPKLLVITCADPRCVPEQFLALQPLEAVVFRNPGGHVGPSMNGLLALDSILGGFSEVMVIHHTDCGTTMFTDPQVRDILKEKTGTKRALDEMTFGAVTDLAQSVRDDLAVLREEPLVRRELKERATGYLYDIQTGVLTKVDE